MLLSQINYCLILCYYCLYLLLMYFDHYHYAIAILCLIKDVYYIVHYVICHYNNNDIY